MSNNLQNFIKSVGLPEDGAKIFSTYLEKNQMQFEDLNRLSLNDLISIGLLHDPAMSIRKAIDIAFRSGLVDEDDIVYEEYRDESMLSDIQSLVSRDLSEPYSIFTYRYFLHNWPNLCVCAYAVKPYSCEKEMIGTIVCKVEEVNDIFSGYIAMLTVRQSHRKRGIGMKLAQIGLERMVRLGCSEIMLEAEATNAGALALYEKLGFARDEKLSRYYLNGGDAYRLKLWIDKNPFEMLVLAEEYKRVLFVGWITRPPSFAQNFLNDFISHLKF